MSSLLFSLLYKHWLRSYYSLGYEVIEYSIVGYSMVFGPPWTTLWPSGQSGQFFLSLLHLKSSILSSREHKRSFSWRRIFLRCQFLPGTFTECSEKSLNRRNKEIHALGHHNHGSNSDSILEMILYPFDSVPTFRNCQLFSDSYPLVEHWVADTRNLIPITSPQ